jgi:TPR repeat protein
LSAIGIEENKMAISPLDSVIGEFLPGGLNTAIRKEQRPTPAPVPERRAVNWADALAQIAAEIEGNQGKERATQMLRIIGARMSRDLLANLPIGDEFEPAINRTLSSLDWGWVAVVNRQDGLSFEHRPPWPFEKRSDQLPVVLEGFYTETLGRLAHHDGMQARYVGRRGSALVFRWLPIEGRSQAAKPKTRLSPALATPEAAATLAIKRAAVADEFAIALKDVETSAARSVADRPLRAPASPVFMAPRRRPAQALPAPPPPLVKTRRTVDSIRTVLICASVFIILFSSGLMFTNDDLANMALARVSRLVFGGEDQGVAALLRKANEGDSEAQIALGVALASGNGVAADQAGAARWFKQAATGGAAEAQYDLAAMTERGLGVKADPVEAAILYMSAAAGGFALAEYRLGVAYETGAGVGRNRLSAATWYERAARHGIVAAQLALGRLLTAGDAQLPADIVSAYGWLALAQHNGSNEAAVDRAALWAKLTPEQQKTATQVADRMTAELGVAAAKPPSRPTVDQAIAAKI